MLNQSILTDTFSMSSFFICLVCSILLGAAIAWVHTRYRCSSKGFIMTIAILPAIVQLVIMLVNGNLGTGIAVMGAFSLIRFRSIPGSAKEINSIFLAMAIGLATGTGYLVIAVIFVILIGGLSMFYHFSGFGEVQHSEKELKITIPEGLDYMGTFDDLFSEYTTKNELVRVRTANMGSLYKLDYHIRLKDQKEEKAFIDQLRCRNGNLEISCQMIANGNEEL